MSLDSYKSQFILTFCEISKNLSYLEVSFLMLPLVSEKSQEKEMSFESYNSGFNFDLFSDFKQLEVILKLNFLKCCIWLLKITGNENELEI